MPSFAPKVLVADDHATTRLALRVVLGEAGFEVCAEVRDAAGAIEAAGRQRPDVCLLDPGIEGDGVFAAEAIARTLPATKIVMFTDEQRGDELLRCVLAGADGYLVKDTDPARVPAVLRAVLKGESVVPRGLGTALLDELRRRNGPPVRLLELGGEALTQREWEVLSLFGDCASTAAIAETLGISPVTVRRHTAEILRKLGVGSRDEAHRLLSGAVA